MNLDHTQFASSPVPAVAPGMTPAGRRIAGAYQGDVADRVRRFQPMVRRLAWHVHGSGRPGIELEDLMQAGLVALTTRISDMLDAVTRAAGPLSFARAHGQYKDLHTRPRRASAPPAATMGKTRKHQRLSLQCRFRQAASAGSPAIRSTVSSPAALRPGGTCQQD